MFYTTKEIIRLKIWGWLEWLIAAVMAIACELLTLAVAFLPELTFTWISATIKEIAPFALSAIIVATGTILALRYQNIRNHKRHSRNRK